MADITLAELVALLVDAESALQQACERFQDVEKARDGRGHIPQVRYAHAHAESVLCKIASMKGRTNG